MYDRVVAAAGDIAGKTVAVLGFAFKPNTDDMREAPSLELVPRLIDGGATVRGCDPEAREEAEKLISGVTFCDNALEAATGADILVVLTEWNEFRALDPEELKKAMRGRLILDLRNIFDQEELQRLGFTVYGLGRGRPARSLAPQPQASDAAQ